MLDRLLKKGGISVERTGRRYLYSAVLPREQRLTSESTTLLDRLFGDRIAPAAHGEENGEAFTAELQVGKGTAPNNVYIKASIKRADAILAQPVLLSTLGQRSGMRVDTAAGPLEVSLLVTELAP